VNIWQYNEAGAGMPVWVRDTVSVFRVFVTELACGNGGDRGGGANSRKGWTE
jgi:hypothetical protein